MSYEYGQVSEKTAQMGEFIKLISDAGDNPRFAVADAKQLLKLYGEQYAYLGDTLVNQIAKLLGEISDDAVVDEEKKGKIPMGRQDAQKPGIELHDSGF